MTPSNDAPPSVIGLLKAYPWLGVLIALSIVVTLWAATRSAPPPPAPIPPAVEPAVEVPVPAVEAEPTVWPEFPPAAPEPVAPAAKPPSNADEPLIQTEDGAWKGPVLAKPQR